MSRKPVLRGAILGVCLATLVGCATNMIVVSETCLVIDRIDYDSAHDTEETIQQIREQHAVLDVLECP